MVGAVPNKSRLGEPTADSGENNVDAIIIFIILTTGKIIVKPSSACARMGSIVFRLLSLCTVPCGVAVELAGTSCATLECNIVRQRVDVWSASGFARKRALGLVYASAPVKSASRLLIIRHSLCCLASLASQPLCAR